MGQLTLNLFGPPEVLHDGRPLSFRTQKALALLIYLAVEGGMHPRAKLATLFWPESDRKAGRATLRTTLLYLRRSLEHDDQEQPHLMVERQALGFNSEGPHEIDVAVVEAAAGAGNDAMRRAIVRCRGEFLEGFTLPDAPAFDEWATFQREASLRRANDLFDHLSQRQADEGRLQAAIETVSRWLTLDPYRERAYRRLMRLHFLAGNRSAALRAHEAACEALVEELGVPLSAETAALAERIRTEAPPRPQPAPEQSGTAPLSALPLVGRGEEHGRLVAAYRRAERGAAQVVTIEGETGVGKTRLADEFLARARVHGAAVTRGKAFESGGRLAYQPVIAALRHCLAQRDSLDDLLGDVWLAELSRILPEIHDRHPGLSPPTGDEAAAQARLFEAVARLGQALAADRPLVLFIDDVQWAGAGSLDLLQVAARRWVENEAPILLLLGLRSEALLRQAPTTGGVTLRQWLSGLERDPGLTRLALGPLTSAETRMLIAAMSPDGDDVEHALQRFSDWLFNETRGHPFYIAETLTALVERDLLPVRRQEDAGPQLDVRAAVAHPAIAGAPDAEGFVAPGVRDMIRDRLSRLSPTAFKLLAAAAVLGYDVRLRTLCRVAGADLDNALPALEELLAAGLLVEDGSADGGAGSYRFAHDKIRDVVYTEAGDARRHLLHERAFQRLEASAANPAQLAHHAQRADLIEPAFGYSLAAGKEAAAVFAVGDAIDHYERARQLLAEHPRLDKNLALEQRHRLYSELGRAYELANEWEAARRLYKEMLAAARSAESPAMEVAALNHLADVAMQESIDVETAQVYLSQAMELAEQAGDRAGLARAEWCMAQATMYSFDRDGAIAHGERALALAREASDEELIARSLNALSYAMHGAVPASSLRRAEEHAREASARFMRLGNRAMEVDSLVMVTAAKIHAGRPRAALRVAQRAHETATAIENTWGQANTAFNMAQALFECGRWGEALKAAEAAVAVAEQHELFMLPTILMVRGAIYRALMAVDKALADHRRARDVCLDGPNPSLALMLALDLCADYAAAGLWQEARRYARETRSAAGWPWMFAALNYWRVVETWLRTEDVAEARTATEQFGARVGDNARYTIPYRRSLALLAEHDGRLEEATGHLQQAISAARRLDLPGELWSLQAASDRLYQKMGEASLAGEARTVAQSLARDLATTLPAELRQRFLTETGDGL